jgi:very-short-patch-repair endonuclease
VEQRGYTQLFEERGVMIGTPEEFQGNERDIIILCFGLGDGIKRYAKSFYEEPRRFNVATSRARGFTIAVIGKIPEGAGLLRRYFSKFGFVISESDTVVVKESEDGFSFNGFSRAAVESEFEHRVADVLQGYVESRNASGHKLSLHNQVLACGKKRLDFVIYNFNGKHSVAVEVDGPSHYVGRTNVLTDEHKQRVAVLRRAGWKIVHLEHRNWYQNGWLCDDAEFANVKLGVFKELDRDLGIS